MISNHPTTIFMALFLSAAVSACASSKTRAGAGDLTVERGGGDGAAGANTSGSSDGSAGRKSGDRDNDPTRGRTRRRPSSSVNARVAMGVQTSSPISDHAQVVIADGDGGAYLGHVVQRDDRATLTTRPGDKRLVMEGGEGAYLSHYDAGYQRINRFILEDIHFVDAIARHPTTGDLYIAGQELFYPKSIKRGKLRLLRYAANGTRQSLRLDKRLLARLPRRALAHRVEDLIIDGKGELYAAITVVRKRKRRERGGRQDVGEMVVVKMNARGRLRWFDTIDTKYNKGGGYYAGSSEITALTMSPKGQLIAIGHSGNNIDKKKPNRGSLDIFVRAFAPRSGKPIWTRTFGTDKRDVARDVAVTSDGALIVVGNTDGQMFAEPSGDDDAFIMALSSDGEPLWGEQLGTPRTDRFHAVTVTGKDAIIAVGETDGPLAEVRPPSERKSTGIDVLIAGYDPEGMRSWMLQAGTAVNDYAAGVAPSSQGGAHLLFDTQGSFQLGQPDAAPTRRSPGKDMVLLRLRD